MKDKDVNFYRSNHQQHRKYKQMIGKVSIDTERACLLVRAGVIWALAGVATSNLTHHHTFALRATPDGLEWEEREPKIN